MDPFAIFALTFGMAVAASQQAALREQYAAHARYAQSAVIQPVWESAPVAYTSAPRNDPATSKAFQDHWQSFMQPSVSR